LAWRSYEIAQLNVRLKPDLRVHRSDLTVARATKNKNRGMGTPKAAVNRFY
jgi:hypothetical protein